MKKYNGTKSLLPTLHLYSVTNSKYVFVYWKYNTRLGFKLYFHPRRHQWWWWEWCVSTAIYGSTTDQKKFSKVQKKTSKCLKRFFACILVEKYTYIFPLHISSSLWEITRKPPSASYMEGIEGDIYGIFSRDLVQIVAHWCMAYLVYSIVDIFY